jgi:DNA-binding NarL/FixJ family response regulator
MTVRVLIVDDHTIVRDGLRSLLAEEPDMTVVAEAGDGRTAVRLAREVLPDVVVMDVVLPDLNGIEATRQIVKECPAVRVVALSMHADRRYLRAILRAGARGYLLKDCAFSELTQAIREVMAGRPYVGSDMADVMVSDYLQQLSEPADGAFSLLTEREREVLQLIAEGNATRDVAEKLSLSVKTVETHRRQIMIKLDTRSVADLTRYAIREGLTTVDS